MSVVTLEFEKPIAELEAKLAEWESLSSSSNIDSSDEVNALKAKIEAMKKSIYGALTPWQRVQLARHPNRPYTLDYIERFCTDFLEFHGDRRYADDLAIVGGFAKIDNIPVMVIGTQKGRNTKENVMRNFGCPHPEGYRKAQRLMDLANKFNMPVLAFVDTDGAFPGVEAEARGQAQAIAASIEKCLQIRVPLVSIVIGMGGSGGAIAIAAANRVLMLEHSIYSVISPEGCASILWRSADKVKEATEALKLTAQDLKKLGVIDEIIQEPTGGAHRDPQMTIERVGDALLKHLKELMPLSGEDLKRLRTEKFLKMGRDTDYKK